MLFFDSFLKCAYYSSICCNCGILNIIVMCLIIHIPHICDHSELVLLIIINIVSHVRMEASVVSRLLTSSIVQPVQIILTMWC